MASLQSLPPEILIPIFADVFSDFLPLKDLEGVGKFFTLSKRLGPLIREVCFGHVRLDYLGYSKGWTRWHLELFNHLWLHQEDASFIKALTLSLLWPKAAATSFPAIQLQHLSCISLTLDLPNETPPDFSESLKAWLPGKVENVRHIRLSSGGYDLDLGALLRTFPCLVSLKLPIYMYTERSPLPSSYPGLQCVRICRAATLLSWLPPTLLELHLMLDPLRPHEDEATFLQVTRFFLLQTLRCAISTFAGNAGACRRALSALPKSIVELAFCDVLWTGLSGVVTEHIKRSDWLPALRTLYLQPVISETLGGTVQELEDACAKRGIALLTTLHPSLLE
jgi:hypothetical protein